MFSKGSLFFSCPPRFFQDKPWHSVYGFRDQSGLVQSKNVNRTRLPLLSANQKKRKNRRRNRSPSGRRPLYERKTQSNPKRHNQVIGKRRGLTGQIERAHCRQVMKFLRSLKNPRQQKLSYGRRRAQIGPREKVRLKNQKGVAWRS